MRSFWLKVVCVWLLCVQTSMVLSAPQTWTVNFNDSEIGEVIKFVADATQKTIVIDPRVKGRVKVISATPLDREQLYNLFLSVLQIHGFTGIEVGGIVRIVPIKEARTSPAPIVDQVDDSGDVSLVTKVLQLKNVAAIKLLPVLRPLVAQTAHIAAYEPSNAIIISDSMANIARMEKLIARIDKAAVATTELVYLENAQAEDVVSILTKLQASGDKGNAQAL